MPTSKYLQLLKLLLQPSCSFSQLHEKAGNLQYLPLCRIFMSQIQCQIILCSAFRAFCRSIFPRYPVPCRLFWCFVRYNVIIGRLYEYVGMLCMYSILGTSPQSAPDFISFAVFSFVSSICDAALGWVAPSSKWYPYGVVMDLCFVSGVDGNGWFLRLIRLRDWRFRNSAVGLWWIIWFGGTLW